MRAGMPGCFARMSRGILLGSIILMAFGCGGGGVSSSGSGGTVYVSMTSGNPDSSLALPAGVPAVYPAANPNPADGIDHAWITVERVALIPGGDGNGPDPSGEPSVISGDPPGPGLVYAEIGEEIDLLDLPFGAARFLNAFEMVPAGTYGKIRLYYTDPKVHFLGAPDNTDTHPTANYHIDIHFKGGDLVIPVSTGGGVKIHHATIFFDLGKDGLKITVNPDKILMRPQVFATLGDFRYVVSGTADNVSGTPQAGTFDIATAGDRSLRVDYGGTGWHFWIDRDAHAWVDATNEQGFNALRIDTLVDVLGTFSSGGVLIADNVAITLPDSIDGTVAAGASSSSGWQSDNTFILEFIGDNVVSPMPSRTGARYDSGEPDYSLLPEEDNAIIPGVHVTARGYAVPGFGIEAFWISVGP